MSAAIKLVTPLVGFDALVEFELAPVEGADGLYALRSADDADVRLFLLDAAVHLPTYKPVLSDAQQDSLGLTSPAHAAVFVVVNPGKPETTVNLIAPIVVNTLTGEAAQFILDGQDWPLRAPLAAAA